MVHMACIPYVLNTTYILCFYCEIFRRLNNPSAILFADI